MARQTSTFYCLSAQGAQPLASREKKKLATRVLIELLHHETKYCLNVNVYALEGPTGILVPSKQLPMFRVVA
jgi:hypothetical protein